MSMSYSDAAKLSALSKLELEQKINELAEKSRPKILEENDDNGYHYIRYDVGCADGAKNYEYVKGTGRNGRYEL